MAAGASVWEDESLKMDVGDSCTTMWRYLMRLIGQLKKGENDQFYVLRIWHLPQPPPHKKIIWSNS